VHNVTYKKEYSQYNIFIYELQSYLFLDETTQDQQDLYSREISEETKEEEDEGIFY
jgi:hypothetical protein